MIIPRKCTPLPIQEGFLYQAIRSWHLPAFQMEGLIRVGGAVRDIHFISTYWYVAQSKVRHCLARILGKVQGTSLYRTIGYSVRSGVIVREASGNDLEEGLEKLFGRKHGSPHLPARSPGTFLAWSGSVPVGFGQLVQRTGEGGFSGFWIHGVYVKPSCRRMETGTRIVAALLSHARDLGAQEVLILVFTDNTPAIRMYERAGFQLVREPPPGIQDYLDTLFREQGRMAIIMKYQFAVRDTRAIQTR